MKIGLIGTGYWGRNHAKVWRALKDEGIIDDVILCDIREEAVKPIAKDFSLPYITNPMKLIMDKSIDAVDISSSTPTHYPLAKNAMLNDKHVLVEKPMAENSRECEEMIRIAQEKNRILMVGHIFRYHPALLDLKKKIARGDLGKIISLHTRRTSLRVPRKDMGVLLALAIHDVDIYTYLLEEEPREVFGTLKSSFVEGIEEEAFIVMGFSHSKGYIFESWNYPINGKLRELVVIGEDAAVRIDYLKPDELEVYEACIDGDVVKNEGKRIERITYTEPLKEELLDFVMSIKEERLPKANMYVGKKSVEIIEKIMESAKEKKVITL